MSHTTVRTQMPAMKPAKSHGPVPLKITEPIKVSTPKSTTFDGHQKSHGKKAY